MKRRASEPTYEGMTREERIEARLVDIEKRVFNGLSDLPKRVGVLIGTTVTVLLVLVGLIVASTASSAENRATLRSIERQVDRIEDRMDVQALP